MEVVSLSSFVKDHMTKIKAKFSKIDWLILIPYIILSVTGVIMVYSASSYHLLQMGQAMWLGGLKQAIFLILSLILIAVIYSMKPKFWRDSRVMNIIFYLTLFLLLFVLLFGQEVNGAKGWINLGFMQFQPLEVFKLMLIIMLARYFTYRKNWSFERRWHLWALIFIGIILILLQPDTGGVVICTLLICALLACAGHSVNFSVWGAVILFALSIFALFVFPHLPILQEYQKARFLVAQHPFDYARGAGHQLINSYYALSNGGWFGVGLGNSIEKQGFLPEAQTDFIFSIIVEELGMLFGLFLIAMILLLVFRILYIGIKAESRFNSYVCIGISMLIFIQMFINLGGLVGLIPLTGVTLPFLSQGGTSLLILSCAIGLALSISANEKAYRQAHKIKKRLKIVE